MKKSLKRGIIALITLAIVAVLAVAVKSFSAEPPAPAETEAEPIVYQVETQEILPGFSEPFSVTGNVTVGQSVSLSADRRANVREVRVAVGDVVKKDDVLVVMHSDALDASYGNSSMLLNNARANVATTEAIGRNNVESERVRLESLEEQLRNTVIQNGLLRRQADEQLAAAKLNLGLSIAQAETGVVTAKKQFENTKAINAANTLVAETGLENALRTARTNMLTSINSMNELLDVSANYRGNTGLYKDRLGTRSSGSVLEAEDNLKQAITAYEAVDGSYQTVVLAAEKTESALDQTLNVLNLTVADPSGALTQPVLDATVANISQQLTALRGAIAGLHSANSSHQATLASNAAGIVNATQQVEAAERQLAAVRQDVNGQSQTIKNAEAQHAATMAQLQTSEDSIRRQVDAGRVAFHNAQRSADLSVLGAKNALASAQESIDQLNISRDALVVRAPFDGIVADLPQSLGAELSAGTVVAVIENPDTLKIEVALTQADANRIQTGSAVRINDTWDGLVMAVAQSANANTKLFDVEVNPVDAVLQPGQFVDLTFHPTAANEASALFVPLSAVRISADTAFVWTVEDSKAARVIVDLGQVQGDHVEVKSGLAPGQEIITVGGRAIEEEGVLVERTNEAL